MTATRLNRLDYYGLVRPRPGHRHAGDAVVIVERGVGLLAGVVDVLGHGAEAHDVAIKADRFLHDSQDSRNPIELLRGLHETLKGTRGAVAGLAVLDAATGVVRYAGVGNTVIRRVGFASDRLVSVDGVLGAATLRSPREQRMTLSPRDVVIMHSDGVRDRFELRDCPQLPLQDARTIARAVIRLFARDYDDAACIAMRYNP